MSELKDFKRDVIRFVHEIEKFPCTYNVNLPAYSNRAETKRAWGQIAEKMAMPEHEVKDKWRKIRIAFSRSLKQQYTHQTSKPYYLFEHLKFLLPYIKFNDESLFENDQSSQQSFQSSTQSSPSSDYDHLEYRSHKNEALDSEDSETIEQQVFQKDTPRNEVTNHNHTVFLNEIIPTENVNSYKIQIPQKRKSDCIENNPRKMFLLSLLPDIESFTQEEMRSFRRSVICTIDNIVDRRTMN